MKLSDSQEPRSVYTVIAPTRVTNDAHGFRRLQCLDPAANLLWERRTAFQRKMRLLDCRIGASREIRMDNTIPRMGCGAFDDTFEMHGRTADGPEHGNRYGEDLLHSMLCSSIS